MKHTAIDTSDASTLDGIPEKCGAVTVGCSDVAGIVEAVIRSSENLRAEHQRLQGTVSALEADQAKVSEASDEARLLSERAMARLNDGTSQIHSSLEQIGSLLVLVEALGQHVTSFSAAMEQVRRTAKDIEEIADTTNILALNATIEAMRAGDAGRAFAVVASEVKSLANDTRSATEEISTTIDALGEEAAFVIGQIEQGASVRDQAAASITQIESTITNVGDLVEEVDKQNDMIARSTSTISGRVSEVQDVLERFDGSAKDNEAELHGAQRRITELELLANDMFDELVQSGLSPKDSEMVAHAQKAAHNIVGVIEAALADGSLDSSQVFDHDYKLIPGSNPERFTNSLTAFADQHWRPILNETTGAIDECVATVCADVNGFMPTHIDQFSRAPTGDVAHDTRYSRNGRIVMTEADKASLNSTDPYRMSVFRQEGDGSRYYIVRSVYVPLFIEGKRWGDLKLAYMVGGFQHLV